MDGQIQLVITSFSASEFCRQLGLRDNADTALSTFKRVTFDFLNARAAFRNLKVMKISFVNIVPSLWAVI